MAVTAEAVVRALTALAVTAALVPLILPLLRRSGVLDVPGVRSSHTTPVPRGAGVAVMLGILVAAALPLGRPEDRLVIGVVVGAAVLYALVGFADDLRGLQPVPRLVAQLVLGVILTWPATVLFHRGWEWIPLGAIAAASYVNVTNFMDGVNGITGWHGIVTGTAFACMGAYTDKPWVVAVGACLAGASLGFLPYNAVRAKVFLGDVGSYGIGATIAALSGGAFLAGLPTEACLGPLAVYLADTGSTLVRRVTRGEDWRQPHRSHVFQRLTDLGFGHAAVALLVAGLTVVTTLLGAMSLLDDPNARLIGDALIVVVLAGYLALPTVLARRLRYRALES
ncbi:MAG TPA: glycosyltransferase family 4 protein [Mycobacteriales bacterium]|nr:glycosyltransferase family 4 protein [Mycobacteriales bacterium]